MRSTSMPLNLAALAFAASAVSYTPAAAQSPEEFYKGKNVNLIIGYSAGGGYDLYARLLARHMGKHIPGKPNLVAQNMPGAGSLKALQFLLQVAPKDGLTFGTFGRSMPLAPLLEDAKFDPSRLEWLGSITADTSVFFTMAKTGVTSLAELKTKEISVGGLARGSDQDMFAAIAKNALGLKVRLVTGYPGTKNIDLALERGELDGMAAYTWSTITASHKSWLDNKRINVLAQMGSQRNPDLPNVPMLSEFAQNDTQRQALELIMLSQTVARPFAMPPGTVKERADAMRAAFAATMKDKEFLAEAEKMRLEVSPVLGAQASEMLRKAYASPKAVIDEARRVIAE
jgi:tripartite-type tricarboxylate transporter receptor subunit TctC